MPDEIAIYVFVRVSRVVSYLRSLCVLEPGRTQAHGRLGHGPGCRSKNFLEELVSDRRLWSLAGLC
jgi:hypothetical protein